MILDIVGRELYVGVISNRCIPYFWVTFFWGTYAKYKLKHKLRVSIKSKMFYINPIDINFSDIMSYFYEKS